MTASASRGKLGRRYLYYHCHRCGGFRERTETVHEAVPAFLRGLQIDPAVAALYRAIAGDLAKETAAKREEEAQRRRVEMEAIDARLLRADELYLEGKLEEDSYRRLKAKLTRERQPLGDTFEPQQACEQLPLGAVSAATSLMEALPAVWARAQEEGDAEAMSDLLGSIIPEKVTYEDGAIRTPWGAAISRLFALKTADAAPNSGAASAEAYP